MDQLLQATFPLIPVFFPTKFGKKYDSFVLPPTEKLHEIFQEGRFRYHHMKVFQSLQNEFE